MFSDYKARMKFLNKSKKKNQFKPLDGFVFLRKFLWTWIIGQINFGYIGYRQLDQLPVGIYSTKILKSISY